MLGHTTIDGRPYCVRQTKNMKASMAKAHARSGDAARIAGYCGDGDTLDRPLADFAEAYGDQTERDHAALVQPVKRCLVKAARG